MTRETAHLKEFLVILFLALRNPVALASSLKRERKENYRRKEFRKENVEYFSNILWVFGPDLTD